MPLDSHNIDATHLSSDALKEAIDTKDDHDLVTFCHGHKAFQTDHLPILEETQTQAIVFITTGLCLDGEDGYLTSQDIVQLAKHPLITLGVTSKTGQILRIINPRLFWNEVTKPRKILSSLTRQSFNDFYLPHTQPNRWFYKSLLVMLGYRVVG